MVQESQSCVRLAHVFHDIAQRVNRGRTAYTCPPAKLSLPAMARGVKIDLNAHTIHEIVVKTTKKGRKAVKMVPVTTKSNMSESSVTAKQSGNAKRPRTDSFEHALPVLGSHDFADLEGYGSDGGSPPPADPLADGDTKVNPNIYTRHSGKISQGTVRRILILSYRLFLQANRLPSRALTSTWTNGVGQSWIRTLPA